MKWEFPTLGSIFFYSDVSRFDKGEEIRVQRGIIGDQSGKTKCPTAAEDWIWHVLYWVTPPCTSAPGRTTRFISRDLHKHPPPSHLSRSPADASETRNIRAPVWPSCTQNEITDSSRLQLIPDVSSCFCCWSDWNGRRSNPGIRKNTGSYMKRQLYQLCAAVFHASPPPVLITRPPWGRYGGPLFNELISFRSDSTDSSEEDG